MKRTMLRQVCTLLPWGHDAHDWYLALAFRVLHPPAEVLCATLNECHTQLAVSCAARIRDHPFMRMHMRILEHRRNKREEAAKTMEQELEQMITEQSGTPERE